MNSSLSSVSGSDGRELLVKKIRNLPTLSPVLQRINTIMANPSSSAADVVGALKLDPAITGKVLRLANSAHIGIPRTVSSLHNAVVLLGQKRIHSLVMASTVLSSFGLKGSAGILDLRRYWQHCFAAGLAAEAIAKHLGRYEAIDADEAFTAGIMHDIGKLVLAGYDPETFAAVLDKSRSEGKPLFACEDPAVAHPAVGEMLAQHWNFPSDLADAIARHHCPSAADSPPKMLCVVHLSDVMVHIIGFQTFDPEIVPQFDETAVQVLGMAPERLRVIGEQLVQNIERIEALLQFVS